MQDAINSAFATFGKRKAPKGAMNRGGRRSPDGSPGPLPPGAVGGAVGGAMVGAVGGALGAVGGATGTSSAAVGGVPPDAYQVEDYVSRKIFCFCCPCPLNIVHLQSEIVKF